MIDRAFIDGPADGRRDQDESPAREVKFLVPARHGESAPSDPGSNLDWGEATYRLAGITPSGTAIYVFEP